MKMKEIQDWVKSHKPHTTGIIVAIIAVIALSVAGATGVFSPKTADTASSETKVTAEVPAKTEKTPLNSEDAKATVTESTEKAQASTETEAKTTVTDAPKSASKSSAPANSNPAPSKPAEKAKTWVPEKGHWENITQTVTVTDQEAWDEQVYTGTAYVFADGYTTTNDADAQAHAMQCIREGKDDGYQDVDQYKTVHHPAKTHTETKVVDRKWVVDVPGHYE